jgi:hypothetical protein
MIRVGGRQAEAALALALSAGTGSRACKYQLALYQLALRKPLPSR